MIRVSRSPFNLAVIIYLGACHGEALSPGQSGGSPALGQRQQGLGGPDQTVIDFSGLPDGTLVTTQYEQLGVTFSSSEAGGPQARITGGAIPGPDYLCPGPAGHSNEFNGAITLTFSSPITAFASSIADGPTVLTGYSASGETRSVSCDGSQVHAAMNLDPDFAITKAVFDGTFFCIELLSYRSSCRLQHYTAGSRFTGSEVWADMDFFASLDAIHSAAAASGVFVHVTSSFRQAGHTVDGAIVPPAVTSNHLAGHAIDMNVEYTDAGGHRVLASKGILSQDPLPAPVAAFITAVKAAGLRWGGDFQQRDVVHLDDGLNGNDPDAWRSAFDATQACADRAGLVVRVHSPVDVLLIDPAGRRLGVDDAGNPVNTVGAGGLDSGPGEPRTLAIRKPVAGQYTIRSTATGTGPYAIELFDAMTIAAPIDAVTPIDDSRSFTGNAVPGTTRTVSFELSPDQVNAIRDVTPPEITASVTPTTLWPPNGRPVDVTVSGVITDDLSGVDLGRARFEVTDDHGTVQPAGSVTVGEDGSFSFPITLIASRRGNDPAGRHYTITVTADDDDGNRGRAAALVVTVPHDQGK